MLQYARLTEDAISMRTRHLFALASWATVVIAFVAESTAFISEGHATSALPMRVFLALGSLAAYGYYFSSKNLKNASISLGLVHAIQCLWGLFLPNSLEAQHHFYLTLFPVVYGFLLGPTGGRIATGFSVGIVSLHIMLSKLGLVEHANHNFESEILVIACLLLIGWIIVSYEENRRKFESDLKKHINQLARSRQEVESAIRTLEAILDHLPIAVHAKDPNNQFKITIWNKQCEKLFGMSAKERIGKTDYESFPKEIADIYRDLDVQTLDTLATVEIPTLSVQLPNGNKILQIRKTAIRDLSGKPTSILSMTEDMTERIWLEKASELSRKVDEVLIATDNLNEIPHAVMKVVCETMSFDYGRYWIASDDLKTIRGGAAFVRDESFRALYEASRNIFYKIGESLPGKVLETWEPIQITHLNDQMVFVNRDLLPGKNTSVIGIPIIENKTFLGAMFFFSKSQLQFGQDIIQALRSISVRVAQVMIRAKDQTMAAHNSKLASLGEMSAGIAHEINNPLAIISGNLTVLEKFRDDPEKFTSKVEAMGKSASRIEAIVRGLKKFSRSTEGNPRKLVPIREIISEVRTMTDVKCNRHGVTFTDEIAKDLSILCERVEIEQVLINLIGNAVDAIKNNEERWVRVEAFLRGADAIIQVVDSGNGIALELEQKLFQPFFTTKPVGEGTGLGLSISKGILDQHGATIRLNRSLPHTCFEICFPSAMASHTA